MKFNLKKLDNFFLGFISGIILPLLFIYVYIDRLYPSDETVFEVLKLIYPGVILGKLMILSVLPDLFVVFLLYKKGTFKIAVSCLMGAVLYIIVAAFMI